MKCDCIAIVSGGLDSTVLVYDLVNSGFTPHMLTFEYGQRHVREIVCARKTARKLNLCHSVIPMQWFGQKIATQSALTSNAPMPEGTYTDETMKQTVVPYRNLVMLSIAASLASSKGVDSIYYAAHAGDHTIYPDCRPEFVHAINTTLKRGDWHPAVVVAPYLNMSKVSIVAVGRRYSVPFEDTWTCYRGDKKACGRCGSCIERLEAFALNGMKDPLEYEG